MPRRTSVRTAVRRRSCGMRPGQPARATGGLPRLAEADNTTPFLVAATSLSDFAEEHIGHEVAGAVVFLVRTGPVLFMPG